MIKPVSRELAIACSINIYTKKGLAHPDDVMIIWMLTCNEALNLYMAVQYSYLTNSVSSYLATIICMYPHNHGNFNFSTKCDLNINKQHPCHCISIHWIVYHLRMYWSFSGT